jgi:hypothetical protein
MHYLYSYIAKQVTNKQYFKADLKKKIVLDKYLYTNDEYFNLCASSKD